MLLAIPNPHWPALTAFGIFSTMNPGQAIQALKGRKHSVGGSARNKPLAGDKS